MVFRGLVDPGFGSRAAFLGVNFDAGRDWEGISISSQQPAPLVTLGDGFWGGSIAELRGKGKVRYLKLLNACGGLAVWLWQGVIGMRAGYESLVGFGVSGDGTEWSVRGCFACVIFVFEGVRGAPGMGGGGRTTAVPNGGRA